MCDLNFPREFTPEQLALVCQVERMRFDRDYKMARAHNPFHKPSASADVPPTETAAVGAALEFFA